MNLYSAYLTKLLITKTNKEILVVKAGSNTAAGLEI